MNRMIAIAMLIVGGCCAGCGMPLYPKVGISVDPATGRVAYQSQMETDLIIGPIEAGVSIDGTKTLKVGTETQPALVYGAKAVDVMDAYARQQEQYRLILEVVGDDITNDLNAIGGWIPGIASMLSGAGVSQSAIDSALAPVKALQSNLKTAKSLIDTCPSGSCK